MEHHVVEKKVEVAEKKAEVEAKASVARDKAACLLKIKAHLLASDKESNIGQNSDYWTLLNEFRGYE
jgi:hypothetical protein